NAANESLAGAAAQTAANLDGFIQTNLDAVRTEAQLPELGEFLDLAPRQRDARAELTGSAARIATMLRALSRRDQLYILSYALLDANGIDVIDTSNSDVGADYSKREYFKRPVTTGLPYVSPVEFPGTPDQPSIYFSAPIRNAQGNTVGVLRVRYNATILQQIVAHTNGLAGVDSSAVLLDENHLRLADSSTPDSIFTTVVPLDPARAAELQTANRLPRRPANQLSTNLPEFERGLANFVAQPFFSAEIDSTGLSREAVAVAPVTAQPWLIAFGQKEAVFLAPAERQTRDSLLIGVSMIVLVALTVAGAAQLLTGPIVRLTTVAARVGAGDLSVQARADTEDEIGKLAKTFNTMTLQLRQTLDGLAERTAELRLANDRLQTELAERLRGETALRESEAKYRTLVNEVNDGFYASDLHGVLTFANRA
ncbi:MAG: HAMP domain-containing protein, partial [Chloroflexota bacterium]|nr:HAMP domain-containing protein [Chloroflexota bacterium]